MVKNHSDYKRGNLQLPLHEPLFLIRSKCFYMYDPRDKIVHTVVFVSLVVMYNVYSAGDLWYKTRDQVVCNNISYHRMYDLIFAIIYFRTTLQENKDLKMANSELKSLLITQREDHDKLKKVGLMIVFFVKFMCLKCVIHYNVCYVFINFSFIIHNFISNFCQQYIFKTCYLFIEGISKYMYVTH